MTNWLYEIDLAGVLKQASEEYDLSCVEKPCPLKVKRALAAELRKASPIAFMSAAITKAKSIAEVNRVLNSVYDVADRRNVWCGL